MFRCLDYYNISHNDYGIVYHTSLQAAKGTCSIQDGRPVLRLAKAMEAPRAAQLPSTAPESITCGRAPTALCTSGAAEGADGIRKASMASRRRCGTAADAVATRRRWRPCLSRGTGRWPGTGALKRCGRVFRLGRSQQGIRPILVPPGIRVYTSRSLGDLEVRASLT